MAGELLQFDIPSQDAERGKRVRSGVFGWSRTDAGGRRGPIAHAGRFAPCADPEGNALRPSRGYESASA